jgi:sigma-E factor negative regulatory protein RseA
MQDFQTHREQISALADGQLRGQEFSQTLAWLAQDEEARRTWHRYHWLGDVLRSGGALGIADDRRFLQNLKPRLQAEAASLSPCNATEIVVYHADETGAGANEPYFRWQGLAGVVALGFVALAGWQYFWGPAGQPGAGQLAHAPVQAVRSASALSQVQANGEPQVMIRDPQLDALLAAHRQFGGTSALQGPSGFLRNATFEGSAP